MGASFRGAQEISVATITNDCELSRWMGSPAPDHLRSNPPISSRETTPAHDYSPHAPTRPLATSDPHPASPHATNPSHDNSIRSLGSWNPADREAPCARSLRASSAEDPSDEQPTTNHGIDDPERGSLPPIYLRGVESRRSSPSLTNRGTLPLHRRIQFGGLLYDPHLDLWRLSARQGAASTPLPSRATSRMAPPSPSRQQMHPLVGWETTSSRNARQGRAWWLLKGRV